MKEILSPWLRLATLKQIRGFATIMECGSISAAARQLHLTAPAVSLQLRELEKAAGIPLLERTETGVSATRGGEAVLKLAEQLQLAMLECSVSLERLSGTDRGIVSVGVVSTARYFAPTVLAAFKEV